MEIFLTLTGKLVPLYALIALGYAVGALALVSKEKVAAVLIYGVAPVVIFQGVVTTDLNAATLALPILFFVLCSSIALAAYVLGRRWWSDSTRNVFAFTAGSGNTGYFGIPVGLMLFGEQSLGLVVLCVLGFIVYENTVGFYLVSRGAFTVTQSLKRVATLPGVYAFIAGVVASYAGFTLGATADNIAGGFRVAFTVLGMALIGMALVKSSVRGLDYRLITTSFIAKFLVWPAVVGLIILVDSLWLHVYGPAVYPVLVLMAITPLAANTVAFAALSGVQTEKAAVTVLLSTVFALVYIPIVVGLLGL